MSPLRHEDAETAASVVSTPSTTNSSSARPPPQNAISEAFVFPGARPVGGPRSALPDEGIIVRRNAVSPDRRRNRHAPPSPPGPVGGVGNWVISRPGRGGSCSGCSALMCGIRWHAPNRVRSSCDTEKRGTGGDAGSVSLTRSTPVDHFSVDRVLDLDTRVHFDEVEFPVLVKKEIRSCPRPDYCSSCMALAQKPHRSAGRCASVESRGGALSFPDLLVPALERAIALTEVDSAALAVTEDLDLDYGGASPDTSPYRPHHRRMRRRPRCGRWYRRVRARSRRAPLFMPRPPPPEAALISTG